MYSAGTRVKKVKDGLGAPKPRKKLKMRKHAYLSEMDLRRIHYLRYGTEEPSDEPKMTLKEVGRRVKLPPSTCYYAI